MTQPPEPVPPRHPYAHLHDEPPPPADTRRIDHIQPREEYL